ncbi:MAG: TFIIB-type zinc ribbon-containing protein, partial [Promethearchaeota archaeon]
MEKISFKSNIGSSINTNLSFKNGARPLIESGNSLRSPLENDLYCLECGTSNIFQDHFGFYVCMDCGLVLEEPVLDKHFAAVKQNYFGGSRSTRSNLNIERTAIGLEKERKNLQKYRNLQRIQNMVMSSLKTRVYVIFSQLSAKCEVSFDKQILFSVFKKFYSKIPKGTKSRNVRLLCSTIFIIKCRRSKIKINLKQILEYVGFSKSDFMVCLSTLMKIDPKYSKYITLEKRNEYIKSLVNRLISEFQLDYNTYLITIKIIEEFSKSLGEKPEIIAATGLALALKMVSSKNLISKYQIAKELGISASTVYSRVKS